MWITYFILEFNKEYNLRIMNERLSDQSSQESFEERKNQALIYAKVRLKEAERYLDRWEIQNTERLLSNSEEAGKRLVSLEDAVSGLEKDIKLIEGGDVEVIDEYWQNSQNQLAQAG